jgi:hypothetical protein
VPAPTFVSSAASSAATFTMPAYNIGDMIIVYAFQFTSTTPVVNPDGSGGPTNWNTIYNATGTNTQAVTIAYRIAHIVGLTSATWTGATRMLVQVWRNTSRGAPPTPIVQSVAATTAGTFPALTIARPPGAGCRGRYRPRRYVRRRRHPGQHPGIGPDRCPGALELEHLDLVGCPHRDDHDQQQVHLRGHRDPGRVGHAVP